MPGLKPGRYIEQNRNKAKRDSSLHRPTGSHEANRKRKGVACFAQNDGLETHRYTTQNQNQFGGSSGMASPSLRGSLAA
jgi:hypothetical protein